MGKLSSLTASSVASATNSDSSGSITNLHGVQSSSRKKIFRANICFCNAYQKPAHDSISLVNMSLSELMFSSIILSYYKQYVCHISQRHPRYDVTCNMILVISHSLCMVGVMCDALLVLAFSYIQGV
jgi:hypothetical protein